MSISPDPNSLVTGLYLQIRTLESALASGRQQVAELREQYKSTQQSLVGMHTRAELAEQGMAWLVECVIRERDGTPDPQGWIAKAKECAKNRQADNAQLQYALEQSESRNAELRRERDEARLDAGLLREKLKWLLDELHDREDITSNGQANIAMGVLAEFKEKFHEQ